MKTYICPSCKTTFSEQDVPQKCPVCGNDASFFQVNGAIENDKISESNSDSTTSNTYRNVIGIIVILAVIIGGIWIHKRKAIERENAYYASHPNTSTQKYVSCERAISEGLLYGKTTAEVREILGSPRSESYEGLTGRRYYYYTQGRTDYQIVFEGGRYDHCNTSRAY